ncbi:MAG TPA: tetratricopeptide repeat protein, partial [Sphingomonadales bacterium]|nr:tetratricopeptide repeat protein [Sphingomonadales bacterium]
QELYGQALLAAQEYKASLEPLRKAAAAADKGNGNLYLQLGHVYSTLEDWKGAAEVMRLAIQKGVDRPDQAYLYMGQAFFNLEDFKRAADAFAQAAKSPNSRRSADSWMSYIDLEQQRIKRLADAGLRR